MKNDFKISNHDSEKICWISNSNGDYLARGGDGEPEIKGNCAYGWFGTRKIAQEFLDKYLKKEEDSDMKQKEMPAKLPPLPKDYVYLGGGGLFETKDPFTGLYMTPYSKEWETSFLGWLVGDTHGYHYAARKDSEIVKLNSPNNMSIEEQIKLAKSLVGKRIKSELRKGITGVITSFVIIQDTSELKNPSIGCEKNCNLMIDAQGCAVVLRGDWGNKNRIASVIGVSEIEVVEVKPWETVKVNGWPAKKISGGYEFGCATISNEVIAGALRLMREGNGGFGNKKVESIRIGAGEFNLDTLQKLV